MAMVAMVLADGDVDESEVKSLLGSISFIKSPETQARLKKYLQHKTMPVLNAFVGWDNKPKARALLLIDLLEVAIADRDLSPKERDQFRHIGDVLGFQRAQLDHFLETGTQAMHNME